MDHSLAEIEHLLAPLAATPLLIAQMTRGLSTTALHARPAKDTWSAHDILAHLRACADVWGASIEKMIAIDRPTIRYVSPRTWIRKTDYLELDFQVSLAAFRRQRDELVKALTALDITGWSRGAVFTATTRGRDGTVFTYAVRILDHELQHLDQLRRTLK